MTNHLTNKTLYYIDQIMKNVEAQKKRMKGQMYKDSIVCFRGEHKYFGQTKLCPSLFREEKSLQYEKGLLDLLSDYGVADETNVSNLSKAMAGQHFIQTSRLLDVTFSILPALYFASYEENLNDINDENKYGYVYSFVFPESFSPNSDYLNNCYDKIVEGNFSPYARDFKVITHSYDNERVRMQNGGFILFTGEVFSKIPNEYYCPPVKILKDDKKAIREELSEFFNIDESTLFPEKDKRRGVIHRELPKTNKHKNRLEKYIDIELEYSLRRIEYEVTVKVNHTDETTKNIHRFLRKEKESLFGYTDKNFLTEKDKLEKKKIIEHRFMLMGAGVDSKNGINKNIK